MPIEPIMPIEPKAIKSMVSVSVIDAFLNKIHNGFDTMASIEQGMWQEILNQINEATVNGLLEAKTVTSHNEAFLSALRHSNEVFAAFKVHALQQEVAAKLLTPDGQLKSFADFRRDVEPITSHQCGAWLQTEYDTAVIRAHNAADWQSFQQNKDIMPNLRWCPTTAPEPEVAHRAFWLAKLNLPVDDPFWQHHHPGDHWNCKCTLEQNNDPIVRPNGLTTKPTKPNEPNMPNKPIEPNAPQQGLDNNPGKDGHIFSDNHPYFPNGCSSCPFNKGLKNRFNASFRNEKKHCYECAQINAVLPDEDEKRRKRVQDYTALQENNLYRDVRFNNSNNGLAATHVRHNFDGNKGWYEKSVQDIGFKEGHKVILEEEIHTIQGKKNTEGTWDDMLFEIASAENATKNNIRNALKHCASKPGTEVAVIFFPKEEFNETNFEQGYAMFKGLPAPQFKKFKEIYCLSKENILYIKKPE